MVVSFGQSERIDFSYLGASEDSVFTVLKKSNVTHHYDTSRWEVYEVFSMEENMYGYYFFDKSSHRLHHYKLLEPHYINGRTEHANVKKNRRQLARMLNHNQKYNCHLTDDNYVEEVTTMDVDGESYKIVVSIPLEENKIIT